MRFGIVCDLIAHAGPKHKLTTIFQLCVQFSFKA